MIQLKNEHFTISSSLKLCFSLLVRFLTVSMIQISDLFWSRWNHFLSLILQFIYFIAAIDSDFFYSILTFWILLFYFYFVDSDFDGSYLNLAFVLYVMWYNVIIFSGEPRNSFNARPCKLFVHFTTKSVWKSRTVAFISASGEVWTII